MSRDEHGTARWGRWSSENSVTGETKPIPHRQRSVEGTTDGIERVVADGGLDAGFFEHVVEEVDVGVGVYDDTGRYMYVNDAYAETLGRTVEELCGTSVWAVRPDVDIAQFDEYWESFDPGETRHTRTIRRRSDGTEFPIETHTTAIEADGRRCHVETTANSTDRVEGWNELEHRDGRLERFASVVSHDLRNPLNVAMGRLQLVTEECDSEHLDPVEDALLRMEALIDDTLTLAREGRGLTEPERVSLRDPITSAWETTGEDTATLDVVGNLGTVQSNESRLCVAFENLFSNALEHGGQAVTIRIGRLESGAGFYVEDDGAGIDPSLRDDVFDYGFSTTTHGTGFGLPIVSRIAEAHGWRVVLADDGGNADEQEVSGGDTDERSPGARFEFLGVTFE